jgi:Tripartite tricarboxylate transporter TctB family
MTRIDLGFSVLLVALGIATVIESWRMPRLSELGAHPWSAPGVVPGLIGAVLLALGLALLGRSIRRLSAGRGDPNPLVGLSIGRTLTCLVLTVGYAGALLGRMPFWVATFLFVTGFLLAFDVPAAEGKTQRLVRVVLAPILGAVVAAAVTLLFRDLFLVRLP